MRRRYFGGRGREWEGGGGRRREGREEEGGGGRLRRGVNGDKRGRKEGGEGGRRGGPGSSWESGRCMLQEREEDSKWRRREEGPRSN